MQTNSKNSKKHPETVAYEAQLKIPIKIHKQKYN